MNDIYGGLWKPKSLSALEKAIVDTEWRTNPQVNAWKNEFQNKFGYIPEMDKGNFDYGRAILNYDLPMTDPESLDLHWQSRGRFGNWYKDPLMHNTAFKEQEIMRNLPARLDKKVILKNMPGSINGKLNVQPL